MALLAPNLYQVRNLEQKVKIVQLLGEPRIPFQVGHGNTSKLSRYLALNIPKSRSIDGSKSSTPYGTVYSRNNSVPPRISSSYNDLRMSSEPTRDIEEPMPTSWYNTENRAGSTNASSSPGRLRRWSLPTIPSLDSIVTVLDNSPSSDDMQLMISPAAEPHTILNNVNDEMPTSPTDSIFVQDFIPPTSSSSSAYTRTLAHSRSIMNKSTRKLGQIFGNDAPIDVGIRGIAEGKLAMLLQSRIPLLYFLAMTIADQNAENLLFWVESKMYEEKIHLPGQETVAAVSIFHTYLASDAPLEINISHKSLRSVVDGIRKASRSCFSKARDEVWVNLDMAFSRFYLSNSLYVQMVHDLGFSCVVSKESMSHIKQILTNVLAAHCIHDDRSPQISHRNVALHAKSKAVIAELSFGTLMLEVF